MTKPVAWGLIDDGSEIARGVSNRDMSSVDGWEPLYRQSEYTYPEITDWFKTVPIAATDGMNLLDLMRMVWDASRKTLTPDES